MAQSTASLGSSTITLRIISPQSITYYSTSSVEVSISAQANPAVVNVAYSLDGGNLTYILHGNLYHTYNGSFSLTALEEGIHRLDVQADTFAPYAQTSTGFVTAHSTVTFSITTKTAPTPTPKPTVTPTDYPTQTPITTSVPTASSIIEPTHSLAPSQVIPGFVLNGIAKASIAIVIVIAVVASIFLVYFRIRKSNFEKK